MLLLNGGIWCHAQHLSQLGRFSIEYERGCSPVTVRISHLDNFGNIARTYFYEDDLVNTTDTFHTYVLPGTYRIVQLIGLDITPKTDTLEFTVLPPDPPEVNVFRCSESDFQLEFPTPRYDYYSILVNGTDSTGYRPGGSLPVISASGTVTVNVTGYYENSFPNCGSSSITHTLGAPTLATIADHRLTEQCAGVFEFTLAVSADSLVFHRILLAENGAEKEVFAGRIRGNEVVFATDLSMADDTVCLRIDSEIPCTGSSLTGQSYCLPFDLSTLRPLQSAYASQVAGSTQIYIPSTPSQVLVSRAERNTTDYREIATVSGSLTDQPPSRFREYSYRLMQTDACGNQIDSLVVSPPYLYLTDQQNELLSWRVTPPLHRLGGEAHRLLTHAPDSSTVAIREFDSPFRMDATLGAHQYIRSYYTYSDSFRIFSHPVEAQYEPLVFVPNAFTPNGDGMNDTLELFGLPTSSFTLVIFNTWGAPAHQISDINPVWDGTLRGQPAPEGTYSYRLVFQLPDGSERVQIGTFALINK